MTNREAERREQFMVYGDLGHGDREEIRRLYFERMGDPVDIAGQFDTDLATVFRIIGESSAEWRKKRGRAAQA